MPMVANSRSGSQLIANTRWTAHPVTATSAWTARVFSFCSASRSGENPNPV